MSRSRTRSPVSHSASPLKPNGANNASGTAGGFKVIVVSGLTKNVLRGHIEEIFGVYGRVEALDMPLFKVCKCLRSFPPCRV